MIQSHTLSRFDEVKEADALFKGSESLGYSGYWPPGHPEAKTGPQPSSPSELYPGILECMAASIPFTQVFTHGDLGIYTKAFSLVNNQEPTNLIQVEQHEITPRPGIKKFLVAGIHKTYDAEALDSVLSACREKNPQMTAYLFKGEKIDPRLDKKFDVQHLEFTWPRFLEAEEFYQKYYRQRLARLYKETRYWPRTPDFQNREEFGRLENALKQFPQVQVYGGPGVGKTAVLARLADKLTDKNKNSKTQSVPVVWVNLDTPSISRAEILIGMGLQLGLVDSLHVLEHPDPTSLLNTLQKDIRRKIESEDVVVVLDTLDTIFRSGRIGIGDPELQALFTGWVAEKLTIGKLSGQSRSNRLVFTGDIRAKEGNDFYKPLKTALSAVIKEGDQKIGVRKLPLPKQEELLLRWLGPVVPGEKTPSFQQEMRRLLDLAGGNLRLLRFLALWAVAAGGTTHILPHLEPVQKAEPWRREDLVISHCFKHVQPREQLLLDTLEMIGQPVHRQVICSGPGMEASLSALIQEGLVIYNKEDKTYEPVYRFGGRQNRRKAAAKAFPGQEKSLKKNLDHAILNCQRLGGITESKVSIAAGFYTAGTSLCEQTGNWELWEGAPVIDAPALLARARYFLKIAKKSSLGKNKEKFAGKAREYAERSLRWGVNGAESHFVCAQALDIGYPRSHEREIESHYEKSIALESYAGKLYSYARYINRRCHDRERAELKFKEAGAMEEKRGRINVIGLHSFAEFYLGWPGHEKEAGSVLNRIIAREENKLRNFFLAGRLYQAMGWRYLAGFFYEAALKEDPKDIKTLNNYANACAAWGDREKAQKLFERALKVDDKHVPTLNSYANACAAWGDREKAQKLFEKALTLAPNDIILLNSYSSACTAWGETAKAALIQKRKETLEKPPQEEMPSRIASTAPAYTIPTPAAKPTPTPTPGTGKEEIVFTLTPGEKTWLTTTTAVPLPLPGETAQWAGFTMLYSLFYWEAELDSLKELGIVPSLQRDYQRLFNLTATLVELVAPAPPTAREIPCREDWFNREGPPLKLIAYYDGQLTLYPDNPVCMAFLVQALEDLSWKGTAKIFKKEILTRVPPSQIKAWQPYLEKPGIDILAAPGNQKFRVFLHEQNQTLDAQTQTPGPAGFTYEIAFNFLNRFTTAWRHQPRYFPWQEFTPHQAALLLGKLLELLRRLKTILAEIRDLNAEAVGPLGEFLREISPLVKMMKRLADTAYELNKPEPIPWYVTGEIKEITDTHLVGMVEQYGRDTQEWVIPRHDFPGDNPQPGQLFYAKIKQEHPGKLLDIEPLPVIAESLEDVLCDLFGKEAYDKLAALSEKEES